jgi:hypothetical protein
MKQGPITSHTLRHNFSIFRRTRVLPFGGALSHTTIAGLGQLLKNAIDLARRQDRLVFDPVARIKWEKLYPDLSEGRPGLFGAATARGDAQTVRLAALYAALDGVPAIGSAHLDAALALCRYCATSARYIFGDFVGDPVADDILRALRQRSPEGMSRNDIRELFGRNKLSDSIGSALATLMKFGLAQCETKASSGGRPATIWYAVWR